MKLQETVLEQYKKGKITIRQGAEMLGLTYWEMDDLLRESQVPLVTDLSIALRRPARKRRRRRAGRAASR